MANLIIVHHNGESFNISPGADRAFIEELFGFARRSLIGLEVTPGFVIPVIDGRGLDASQVELIGQRAVTCRFARHPVIDWTKAKKMVLSGGTGGTFGEHIYIPRPGKSTPIISSQCQKVRKH
jgi:hypothetical protein